jgi:hypothetical protein
MRNENETLLVESYLSVSRRGTSIFCRIHDGESFSRSTATPIYAVAFLSYLTGSSSLLRIRIQNPKYEVHTPFSRVKMVVQEKWHGYCVPSSRVYVCMYRLYQSVLNSPPNLEVGRSTDFVGMHISRTVSRTDFFRIHAISINERPPGRHQVGFRSTSTLLINFTYFYEVLNIFLL